MNALTLEERAIGYLLTKKSSFTDVKDIAPFLDDPEPDLAVLQQVQETGEYNSPPHLEVEDRNPFLSMNAFYPAKNILNTAIKQGSYDLGAALLKYVSDPKGRGQEGYAFYDGNVGGVHSPTELLFYHALGKSLGIGSEVESRIKTYVSAYKQFWDVKIASDSQHPEMANMNWNNKTRLGAFLHITEPEHVSKLPPGIDPLLPGDLKVIEILSSVTPKNLQAFSEKYS